MGYVAFQRLYLIVERFKLISQRFVVHGDQQIPFLYLVADLDEYGQDFSISRGRQVKAAFAPDFACVFNAAVYVGLFGSV